MKDAVMPYQKTVGCVFRVQGEEKTARCGLGFLFLLLVLLVCGLLRRRRSRFLAFPLRRLLLPCYALRARIHNRSSAVLSAIKERAVTRVNSSVLCGGQAYRLERMVRPTIPGMRPGGAHPIDHAGKDTKKAPKSKDTQKIRWHDISCHLTKLGKFSLLASSEARVP